MATEVTNSGVKSREEIAADVAAFRADLASRPMLDVVPAALPPLGSLVRVNNGPLVEIVHWFDRNPGGKVDISPYRVALVELDGPISDREFDDLTCRDRFVFEHEMTPYPEPTEVVERRRIATANRRGL